MPNTRRKLAVKEPRLCAPTAKQMSATVQSVAMSSAAARSSRRVSRYWCGDSPKVSLNRRLKWAGDSPAAAARSATASGSKYRASARSFARRRCLAVKAVATPSIVLETGAAAGGDGKRDARASYPEQQERAGDVRGPRQRAGQGEVGVAGGDQGEAKRNRDAAQPAGKRGPRGGDPGRRTDQRQHLDAVEPVYQIGQRAAAGDVTASGGGGDEQADDALGQGRENRDRA